MKQANIHLISHALCPFVQRSVIVLKEKNMAFKRTDIDLSNKPEWFKKVSPLGKVPILKIDDNNSLFESSVISEYIDETTKGSLHPQNALEKALHRAWIEFGSTILGSIFGLYTAQNKEVFEYKRLEIKGKFQQLEKIIGNEGYFSENKFHLIDAVYGPIFRYFEVFASFIDLEIFDELSKVNKWRKNLLKRPSVQSAVSENYQELLLKFLKDRNSYFSTFIV